MIYPKEKFDKDLDNLLNKMKQTKLTSLVSDLSDVIVFSCVFAGKADVNMDKTKIKLKNPNQPNSKEVFVSAVKYNLISYDKTIELTVIVSENYYSFKKVNDTQTYKYFSEYNFDDFGNFTRKCELEHEQLNIKQHIIENSLGNNDVDIFFTETMETVSNIKIISFKLPDMSTKKDSVYFRYLQDGIDGYLGIAKSQFNLVPFTGQKGMTRIAEIMAEQFDEEDEKLKITDARFFNRLEIAAKHYYKKDKLIIKEEKK